MPIDTFAAFGVIDIYPDEMADRREARKRLVAEDAALRPWLIGRALRAFRYTPWTRLKYVVRETVDAAVLSWRTSR